MMDQTLFFFSFFLSRALATYGTDIRVKGILKKSVNEVATQASASDFERGLSLKKVLMDVLPV